MGAASSLLIYDWKWQTYRQLIMRHAGRASVQSEAQMPSCILKVMTHWPVSGACFCNKYLICNGTGHLISCITSTTVWH